MDNDFALGNDSFQCTICQKVKKSFRFPYRFTERRMWEGFRIHGDEVCKKCVSVVQNASLEEASTIEELRKQVISLKTEHEIFLQTIASQKAHIQHLTSCFDDHQKSIDEEVEKRLKARVEELNAKEVHLMNLQTRYEQLFAH